MKLRLISALLASALVAPTFAADEALARLFSTTPKFSDYQISPDGQHLSVVISDKGVNAMLFLDRATRKVVGQGRPGMMYLVGDHQWVDNERVMFKLMQTVPWQKQPGYAGELFTLDYTGRKGEIIYGYSSGERQVGSHMKKKEGKFAAGFPLDSLADEDGFITLLSVPASATGRRAVALEILKVHVETGRQKNLGGTPSGTFDVAIDSNGRPLVAAVRSSQNLLEVHLRNHEEMSWSQLPSHQFGNAFSPQAVSADNSTLYVLDNWNADQTGVYSFSLKDGAYKPVLVDDKASVRNVLKTVDQRGVYAVEFDDGKPSYALMPGNYPEGTDFKDVLGAFPGERVSINGRSKDGQFVIVRTESDKAPASYHMIDFKAGDISLLGSEQPEIAKLPLQASEPFKIKSFDGMMINGYFTKAAKDSAAKPLIVMVHGGPQARDYWEFDTDTQYLSQLGYNVLRVNFRGSAGFGLAYEQAGYKHWGDHIQQDIKAAADWAQSQGYGKDGNTCIYGGSFGGYSALQSSVMYPGFYKCAAAVAGVYDLEMMYKKGDISEVDWGIAFLEERMGKDPALLKAHSPIHAVDKLQSNLLLVHGKKDRRVPFAHAEALMAALDKAGKKYQWLEFEDETHGFYGEDNQTKFRMALADFFAANLKQ